MVPPNPAQIEQTLNPVVRSNNSSSVSAADCLSCRVWSGSALVVIGAGVASNARKMTSRANAVTVAITGAGEFIALPLILTGAKAKGTLSVLVCFLVLLFCFCSYVEGICNL